MSLRYQAKMVSGLATEATCSSVRRPIRLAISVRVARCALVKGTRAGKCERRILFSAIRYSFCSRSCWFTMPLTYANRRDTCVFLIEYNSITTCVLARPNILAIRAGRAEPGGDAGPGEADHAFAL